MLLFDESFLRTLRKRISKEYFGKAYQKKTFWKLLFACFMKFFQEIFEKAFHGILWKLLSWYFDDLRAF